MGKLRFKLSHVMPHVWFYKLKEIGKTGEHSHGKSSQHNVPVVRTAKSGSLGRLYTSPVNHKSIDISFPETPKRSPLNQSLEGDESGMTNASIVSQKKASQALITCSPSANGSACTSRPFLTFSLDQDVAAFEVDDDAADTPAASEGKLAEWGNGVCFDVRELERRLKALGSEERRKYYNSPMFSVALPSPILDAPSEVDAPPQSLDLLDSSVFGEEGCCTTKAFCQESKPFEAARSSNASTSFRQSTTSASDTGLDRASSSLWERDVFSLTSEGSDLFTTIDEIDSSLLQRSIRQHRKPKEKKRYSSKSSKAAELGPFFYASHDFLNKRRPDNGKSSRGTINSCNETQAKASSGDIQLEMQQGRRTDSVKYSQLHAEQPLLQDLLKYEECNLSMLEYECDDCKGRHRRGLSNEFSYSESKDRLLSGRLSFEQHSESALSESELETASKNYTRFKLKQRLGGRKLHGNLDMQRGRSPDPGLYKVSSKQYAQSHEDNSSHSKNSSRRSSTDSRSSYQNTGVIEEPSWYKGTLRVVKEKTKDHQSLHHKQFASNSAHSRVFDSFAMVKCSYDPRQDFKDSMVEMIIEKELHTSSDLVELLQCYLTLNSEKYHDTIVKVFSEVWSDLFHRA